MSAYDEIEAMREIVQAVENSRNISEISERVRNAISDLGASAKDRVLEWAVDRYPLREAQFREAQMERIWAEGPEAGQS